MEGHDKRLHKPVSFSRSQRDILIAATSLFRFPEPFEALPLIRPDYCEGLLATGNQLGHLQGKNLTQLY